MTIAQMVQQINNIETGVPINPANETYVRPEEYPDLDSITIPDTFEGLYLTYDLRLTPGYGWIGLFVQTRTAGAKYYVERGHLASGEFVTDYSAEMTSENSSDATSGRYFRQALDENNGNVQLWRIRTDDRIGAIRFCSNSAVAEENVHIRLQPCVERVGRLGYVWEVVSNGVGASNATVNNNGTWSTYWLRRDKVTFPSTSVVNRLSNAYANSYSLQEVDMSGWDTTNWAVTTLATMFYQCYKITNIDMSNLDTTNWAVTTLQGVFQGCQKLKTLKLGWDTSNWAVTTTQGMFSDCQSLTDVDLDWNTESWAVTTIQQMFYNCYGLKNLKLNWDTSNWAVTNIAQMFSGCWGLISVDFSSWDTSGWRVTTMSQMFYQNRCLKELDLCWDTDDWVVTDMSGTFNGCTALAALDTSSWDTSGWAVTTLDSCFQQLKTLKVLDLTDWDTSNWPLTNMSGMFRYSTLFEIDMSTWSTTKFDISNMRYCFDSCSSLSKVLFPNIVYNGTSTNIQTGYPTNSTIINWAGYQTSQPQDYTNAFMLSTASLVSILQRLATVSSGTITLGAINKLKLSAEQIAIATAKGWTVS